MAIILGIIFIFVFTVLFFGVLPFVIGHVMYKTLRRFARHSIELDNMKF